MKIVVKVKVNARADMVEKIDDGDYVVHTTALPVENKANEKVLELLGAYFGIAKSRLRMIRGFTSHNKVIEVAEILK
jgi:uncharacterized protein YggU (UPF0235/DUF167 family)